VSVLLEEPPQPELARHASEKLARREVDPLRSRSGDGDLIADLPQPDTRVVRDASSTCPWLLRRVQLGICSGLGTLDDYF
jgi:hypothetical protein